METKKKRERRMEKRMGRFSSNKLVIMGRGGGMGGKGRKRER